MLPTQHGTGVPRRAPAADQRIVVVEILAFQIGRAEQRVVHRLFVKVGVLRVVIGEVHFVLEENHAATRAGFAIGVVAQRIVRAEAFRGLAAAHAAGDVILLVDHVVPERHDRALVIHVVGFRGDVGHAGIIIDRAHGVPDGLILLRDRQVALVVFCSLSFTAA